MGWDAHATTHDGEWLDFKREVETCRTCGHESRGRIRLTNPRYRYAYELAAEIAKDRSPDDTVDIYLSHGGLDVSSSGHALQEATGLSVYSETGWTPLEVRRVASCAYQDEDWPNDCYGWSARLFLATTATLRLGVGFTW